jgi:hypothetical protein
MASRKLQTLKILIWDIMSILDILIRDTVSVARSLHHTATDDIQTHEHYYPWFKSHRSACHAGHHSNV